MSLTAPAPQAASPAAPPVAKPRPAHPPGTGQTGQGGVSPFAQMLQGAVDDDPGNTASPDPSATDDDAAADDAGERPGEARGHADKRAHDAADDATAQPAQAVPDAPAVGLAASLRHAGLLAAARAKAVASGVEAAGRGRRAAADIGFGNDAAGTGRASSLAQAGAQDAQSLANPGGLDIAGLQPALGASAVNLASAEAGPAGVAGADFSLPSLGATGSAGAAPSAPPDAAPAQAALAPPPGSAAFPAALGAQLSTWLKDGVQYATLELNPQDMGPIDVRIALRDGRTQVELGADVPATRAALTEALPGLAEALGDVGLSLAGGSVSDQTGQHARQGEPQGQRAFALPAWLAPGRDGDGGTAASAARPAQRGLIDLVA